MMVVSEAGDAAAHCRLCLGTSLAKPLWVRVLRGPCGAPLAAHSRGWGPCPQTPEVYRVGDNRMRDSTQRHGGAKGRPGHAGPDPSVWSPMERSGCSSAAPYPLRGQAKDRVTLWRGQATRPRRRSLRGCVLTLALLSLHTPDAAAVEKSAPLRSGWHTAW
jgi:hypothetical protein